MQKRFGQGEQSYFGCGGDDAAVHVGLVPNGLSECRARPVTTVECAEGSGDIQTSSECCNTHHPLPVSRVRHDERHVVDVEYQELLEELLLDLICSEKNGLVKSKDRLTNIVRDLSNRMKTMVDFEICQDSMNMLKDEGSMKAICREMFKNAKSDEQYVINTLVLMTYVADECSRMTEEEYMPLVRRLAYIIVSSNGGYRTVSILKAYRDWQICKNNILKFGTTCIVTLGIMWAIKKCCF